MRELHFIKDGARSKTYILFMLHHNAPVLMYTAIVKTHSIFPEMTTNSIIEEDITATYTTDSWDGHMSAA
jgi:hypothetical protein